MDIGACWRRVLVGLATGTCLTSPGFSVDAPEAASAEPDAIIEEITVTATRSARQSYDFPGSVSVVTKQEIDDLVASSVSDLFVNVPSVQFTGGPRRTGEVPTVRGASTAGVLVLFDGVRQNFLSGHDGRFFIDPSLLRAAEVVRGSAASLYGSGTLGGVIAFETLDAADLTGDDAQMAVQLRSGYQGVNNEALAGLTLGWRSDDERLDTLASITWRDAGDIALGNGTSLAADDEIGSGLVKVGFQATDALALSAQWIAYRGDAREPNNAQLLNIDDLVDKDINNDTLRLGARYNPADNDWVDASLTVYYSSSSVDEALVDSPRFLSRALESYGALVENRSTVELSDSLSLSLTTGAEYFRDDQRGFDSDTADNSRGGVPDGTSDTFGAFVQAELTWQSPAGRVQLIPSARYDDFKLSSDQQGLSTNENAFNPRLAAGWEPAEWLLLFASWGESFRAPSMNELFANGIHFQIPLILPGQPPQFAPNFFIPNADLQPEDAETWEFGGGLKFADIFSDGDQFQSKVTYFDTSVSNLIDLAVDVAFSPACFSAFAPGSCTAGTSQNVNAARAQLEGVEVEASYDSDYVFASFAFSSVTGRNQQSGEFLGVLTPDRFNIIAGVKAPDWGVRLGLRSELADRFTRVNTPADERPAYETLDLFASWSPPEGTLKGLRIDIGVDNVTDATVERIFAGVPDPGRNYKAAVRYTYRF